MAQSKDLIIAPSSSTAGLITKSYSLGTTGTDNVGKLILNSPRWLPANTAGQTIGQLAKVSYTSHAAKQTEGTLELVATADGQVYVRVVAAISETPVLLLGESKIQNITGLTATENSIVYVEGKKLIDEVAQLSNKKQPGAGSILVRDSKFTSALSNKTRLQLGELPNDLHPLVWEWFENPKVDNAVTLLERGQHGKCAEPKAVSLWLFDYEKATGIAVKTIDETREALNGTKSIAFETITKYQTIDGMKTIRAEIGDIKEPCISCNPFLEYFGILEIYVPVNLNLNY